MPHPGSLQVKTSVVCNFFCLSGKIKNLHLLFAKLLRHKTGLYDFGIVVFPSKKPERNPDVRHGDRSQLSQSLIGHIQVS